MYITLEILIFLKGEVTMIISKNMVEQAYLFGKRVYLNEVSRNQAKFEVNSVSGMDIGSAHDYITVFLSMMDGLEYRRTINTYATEYYLNNIYKDFGTAVLQKAVYAVISHTKYYKTLGRGSLRSIENVANKFKEDFNF